MPAASSSSPAPATRLPRPALGAPARGLAHERLVDVIAGSAPRRALRRVRRPALRAQGAARADRPARVRLSARARGDAMPSSTSSASSASAEPTRDGPDYAPSRLLAAVSALFAGRGITDLSDRCSTRAELLVRLHLAGFFWGDSSLSNILFRRDAGALSAYLVDAETGELHPSSRTASAPMTSRSPNERGRAARRRRGARPTECARRRPRTSSPRYEALWTSSRARRSSARERYRIDERLHRLNDLGFDVEELELVADDDGYRLRLNPHVVEPGHHRRRLLMLTGLHAQENQARRLLNDIARFRAQLEKEEGRPFRDGRRLPLARRGVRAGDRGRAGRALGKAGGGRGLPRGARAPLVPLASGRTGRRRPRGDARLRAERPAAGERRANGACSALGPADPESAEPGDPVAS